MLITKCYLEEKNDIFYNGEIIEIYMQDIKYQSTIYKTNKESVKYQYGRYYHDYK